MVNLVGSLAQTLPLVPRVILKPNQISHLSLFEGKAIRIRQDGDSGTPLCLNTLMKVIRVAKVKVHELWLDDVTYTKRGITLLSREIKSIRSLKLGGVPSTEKEAVTFSLGLRKCSRLENISLIDLPVGEKGVDAILQAFKEVAPLKSIHLSNCSVGDRSLKALLNLLEKKNLEDVHLYRHTLSPETVAALKQAAKCRLYLD